MKIKKFTLTGLIMLLLLVAGAGCSAAREPIIEPTVLEGADRDAVLSYAQEPSENLLEGLLARDYTQFSRDFSDDMKQGMNEQAFNDLVSMFDTKLGVYQSMVLVTVLQDENYTTLVYQLIYEKDNEVSMRVVFDNKEPHKISGVWFDSPELREN